MTGPPCIGPPPYLAYGRLRQSRRRQRQMQRIWRRLACTICRAIRRIGKLSYVRMATHTDRATRPPPDPHRTDPYLVYGLRQSRAKSPKRRCPPLGHSDHSLQLLEVKADLHVGEFVTILKVSPHTELPDPHRTPIGPPRGSLPRAYAHGSTAACPTFVSRT